MSEHHKEHTHLEQEPVAKAQHFLQQNYNDLALVQKLIAQIASLAIAYE